MIRRVIGALGDFMRQTKSVPTKSPPPPEIAVSIRKTGLEFDEKARAMQKAHQNLTIAIKELSGQESIPITTAPSSILEAWAEADPSSLTVSQIEELARVYFEGNSTIKQNKSRAIDLWSIAMEKGSIESRYSRALCYKDGIEVTADPLYAMKELEKLISDHDYHLAHYSLAVLLDKGAADAVAQDLPRAFEHFKKAAKGGVQPALHNIGNAYATGRGVKQSDHNARLYFEAAAEAGDPFSCFTLGTWYYSGRGGLQESKEKAFQWQLKAAEMGHPAASFNVGVAYLVGEGIGKSKSQAVYFLEKAAAANIVEAVLNLAKVYVEDKRFADAERVLLPFRNRHEIATAFIEEIEILKKR